MSQVMSWQRRRAGVEAVLARIAAEPGYRRTLLDSPGEALAELGIELEPVAEVQGYRPPRTCGPYSCGQGKTCGVTCTITA